MSTCKLILAIAVGVYFGLCIFSILQVIIKMIAKAIQKKMDSKKAYAGQKKKIERDQANKTGRVIGFRPIEQEERA